MAWGVERTGRHRFQPQPTLVQYDLVCSVSAHVNGLCRRPDYGKKTTQPNKQTKFNQYNKSLVCKKIRNWLCLSSYIGSFRLIGSLCLCLLNVLIWLIINIKWYSMFRFKDNTNRSHFSMWFLRSPMSTWTHFTWRNVKCLFSTLKMVLTIKPTQFVLTTLLTIVRFLKLRRLLLLYCIVDTKLAIQVCARELS